MAAVKWQVCRVVEGGADADTVAGVVSCDFRGHGPMVGFADAHATIPQLESDPASDAYIERIVEDGPRVNATFKAIAQMGPGFLSGLASALGLQGNGTVYLRVCVMDE